MIREANQSIFPLHADHVIDSAVARRAELSEAGAGLNHAAASSDLKRRILNFLASRNRPGLRQIEVRVEGGVVLLSGRVRSYYDKQLASHCCSRVAGVIQVIDGICVIPEPSEIAVG